MKQKTKIFKIVRNQKKMTGEKLAEKTGIERSKIYKFENGQCNSTLETLCRLAEGMNKELHLILADPSPEERNIQLDPGDLVLSFEVEAGQKEDLERFDFTKNSGGEKNIEIVHRENKLENYRIAVELLRGIKCSDILKNNPEVIRLSFSDSSYSMSDIGFSLMNLLVVQKNYQGIEYNKPFIQVCGNKNDKVIYLEFAPRFRNIDAISQIIKHEEKMIRTAEEYLINHPFGFDYLVFDPSDSIDSNMLDLDFNFEIVSAWTKNEALEKYLERNREERRSLYYYSSFVRDFLEIMLDGDGEKLFDNYSGAKELYDDAYSKVEKIENEEKNIDELSEKIDVSKLYSVVGNNEFDNMWFEHEESNIEIILDERQKQIKKYLD